MQDSEIIFEGASGLVFHEKIVSRPFKRVAKTNFGALCNVSRRGDTDADSRSQAESASSE